MEAHDLAVTLGAGHAEEVGLDRILAALFWRQNHGLSRENGIAEKKVLLLTGGIGAVQQDCWEVVVENESAFVVRIHLEVREREL